MITRFTGFCSAAGIIACVSLSSCSSSELLDRSIISAQSVVEGTATQKERYLMFGQASLDGTAPYLKAHMVNGRVYVLRNRRIEATSFVEGDGILLDANRDTLAAGTFQIPIDSVAIFETNVLEKSGPTTAMTIITGASVLLTGYCALNPKACFGSCPTFYVSDGDSLRLQAEGFSASIAPSLEARDLDALYRSRVDGSTVRVEMRNEALETHVVRHVDLVLAAKQGGRAMADKNGNFWQTTAVYPPEQCLAEEGDCLPLVNSFDDRERFSKSDSTDLASREDVFLTFDVATQQRLGLVVGARQTLLTTYVLYQTLAYMGRDAGHWFSRLERADESVHGSGLGGVLGGIEVSVRDSTGAWVHVDELIEYGPLATDVHVVPLPTTALHSESVELRLRLTRGNWRIDYLALAELDRRIQPVRVSPSVVFREGVADTLARTLLMDSTQVLTTLPGDVYSLVYELPDHDESYELFLESRGYYLEWMREEWLEDESPQHLAGMFLLPQIAMKWMAPEYKKVEASMEDAFWRSRYAKR